MSNTAAVRLQKYLLPLGMIAVISYFCHTILGRVLRDDYNPITTDISSLTAVGAPNQKLLLVFTTIYGVLIVLFAAGMVIKAFNRNKTLVRAGWILILFMNLVSLFGYMLFPLSGDKTVMTLTNAMHIVVTMLVVLSTIAGTFCLAFGYLRQEKDQLLGRFALVMACLITVTGAMNPIAMANGWNVLGLLERASIYSIQVLMFSFSAYYTFFPRPKRAQLCKSRS